MSESATVKAYINRCKLCNTAAVIFLSDLCLKEGICWVYGMVDFICMGLLNLRGTRTKRELQNQYGKFLPKVGFEQTTLDVGNRRLIVYTTTSFTNERLKVNGSLPVLFILTYTMWLMKQCVLLSRCIEGIKICIVLLFDQYRCLLTVKC